VGEEVANITENITDHGETGLDQAIAFGDEGEEPTPEAIEAGLLETYQEERFQMEMIEDAERAKAEEEPIDDGHVESTVLAVRANEQLSLFDYAQLDSDIREDVRRSAVEIKTLRGATEEHIRKAQNNMIEIGRELTEAKSKIPHGHWQDWLEQEFRWSQAQAQRLMTVYERFGQKRQIAGFDLGSIDLSGLYRLSAAGTEESAIDEAVERVTQGERLTHADAVEIVERHKPERQVRELFGEERESEAAGAGVDSTEEDSDEEAAEPVDAVLIPSSPSELRTWISQQRNRTFSRQELLQAGISNTTIEAALNAKAISQRG